MAKASAQKFRTEPLAELARQLHYSPKARRHEQLDRAERLHDEVEPTANYPFDYIAYRITHIRPGRHDTVLLVGEAVSHDLRLIIDALSRLQPPPERSSEQAPDQPPTESLKALAQRLAVSTRTIHRWRGEGLRWRWVQVEGRARPRLCFTQQAVAAFMAQHPDRVQQANRFTHLTESERERLLHRAARLGLVTEASPHQVAAHLARRTGRGVETIRQLLHEHDRNHPERPIFPGHSGPLTPWQQRVIARAYRRGVPVGRIARRFQRSRASIYRVIHERRASEAQRVHLKYVDSTTFHREDADAVLLRSGVEREAWQAAKKPTRAAANALPEPLQPLYRQPVIGARWQRFLLLRYNYLKHRAAEVRRGLDRYHPRSNKLDGFDDYLHQARTLQALLVRTNLPTVLSLARRHLLDTPDPNHQRLIRLLAAGHRGLGEAIETYDPGRSQDFAAYLTNRLMRRFANDPTVINVATQKAQRRLTDEQALAWLQHDAHQAGVPLPSE